MSTAPDPSPAATGDQPTVASLLGRLSSCAAEAEALDPGLAAELRDVATGLRHALGDDTGSFRAILDASRDAIVSADEHGRVVFFNDGAEAMFGHTAADVLGRPLETLMPERYRAAHRAGMARFAATGDERVMGRTVELEGLRADGAEFPIELSLGTTVSGGRRAFTGIIRDVSERMAARLELPAVEGDAQQLGQLFQNLLGNALKFTPVDREPEIEVSAEPGPGGWVFTVADNGIGFDAVHAERIFRMFQRLHGRDEYPGTGVGLAIARKVVEGHGGRIWAEPRPEGGAAFRFELPGSAP